MSRRTFTSVALGSLTVGAGCLNGGGRSSGGSGGGDGSGYGDWFDGVDNYDGVVDRTGTGETTVKVGSDDGFAFGPAAIAVDVGTTVVWEWIDSSARHNVVARDDTFSSPYHEENGATFEYTFEESGLFPYYCVPHRTLGMKGGVSVGQT